ncbi:MAG TPA: sigma-70 family RNA polymerase sigma factor [Casimicrobium sp.]|nr:sigma-70 family RNA polymerase sigma factor [Casimicrobium sp.]
MNPAASTPNAPASPFACVTRACRAHESELRGYLRHRLGDDAAADDVLQDVFLKALRQGQVFCALDNPRAWLFQVSRNALVDRARATGRTEPLADDAHETVADAPEEVSAVDALTDCLARVLTELSLDDAAILQACDLDGQTQREFAGRNDLSLAATKSRLLRARHRLRDRLTTACGVRFDERGQVCCHTGRSSERHG